MTNLSMRPASPDDIEALARINVEVQDLHFENRPDQFKPSDQREIERWIEQLLQNPSARLWVADSGGALVGYVVVMVREKPENPFCPSRKWWELDQMGVVAARRRSGIGRALVRKVISEARAHGIDELELQSWTFNQNAQNAFSSLGFTPKIVRYELRIAESRET
jgi:diamine N-acetyltransferase